MKKTKKRMILRIQKKVKRKVNQIKKKIMLKRKTKIRKKVKKKKKWYSLPI